MITIIADFDVKNDCVDEFIKLARECTMNTKKEAGCLSYKVFDGYCDKSKFTFIEEWANELAIEKHNEMPHFKKFIDAIGPVLNCPPSIKKISRVTVIR